jgi:hypothetical protein
MDKNKEFNNRTYNIFIICFILTIAIFAAVNIILWNNYFSTNLSEDREGKGLLRIGYLYFPDYKVSKDNTTHLKKHLEVNTFEQLSPKPPVDVVTIGDSFSNFGGGSYYQDYIASHYNLTVVNIPRLPKKDQLETAVILLNSGYLESIHPKVLILESVERSTTSWFTRKKDFTQTMERAQLNQIISTDPNKLRKEAQVVNTTTQKTVKKSNTQVKTAAKSNATSTKTGVKKNQTIQKKVTKKMQNQTKTANVKAASTKVSAKTTQPEFLGQTVNNPKKTRSSRPSRPEEIFATNRWYFLNGILFRTYDRTYDGMVLWRTATRPVFSSPNYRDVVPYYAEDINPSFLATPADVKKINDNIETLRTMTESKNISFYYMLAADKYGVYYDLFSNKPKTKNSLFDLIRNSTHKYKFIDTNAILKGEVANGTIDIYSFGDTHWSWKGAKAVAESLNLSGTQ